MRLLFDEQLSARLCSMLANIYPGSLHVGQVDLSGAADDAVWRTAAERGCVLVTKDDILRFDSQDDVTFLSLGG